MTACLTRGHLARRLCEGRCGQGELYDEVSDGTRATAAVGRAAKYVGLMITSVRGQMTGVGLTWMRKEVTTEGSHLVQAMRVALAQVEILVGAT